jgi:hypothetical protein
MEWYGRCIDVSDSEMSMLKIEPLLDSIRSDTCFQRLPQPA